LLKEEWMKKYKSDRETSSLTEDWASYVSRSSVFRGRSYDITNFEKNSPRILRWALYWPWSLVGTLFNDPVRKAFEYLYHHYLVGTFKRSFQNHVINNYEMSQEELEKIRSDEFHDLKQKNTFGRIS